MKYSKITMFLAIIFAVPVCMASPPTHWASVVKADANLHRIDHRLYRSEQLTADDRDAVKSLGIRSIINLRYFQRNRNKQVFAPNDGITLINQPLLTWRITAQHLAKILWEIERNQKDGAVLVHCYHGADRTGIVVAFYRIIYHGWSIAEAKAEMQQGGYGYHRIWQHLDTLLNDDTVAQVRTQLTHYRQKQ